MAAVSLFWDTNMTAVTSCENTLFGPETWQPRPQGFSLTTHYLREKPWGRGWKPGFN